MDLKGIFSIFEAIGFLDGFPGQLAFFSVIIDNKSDFGFQASSGYE